MLLVVLLDGLGHNDHAAFDIEWNNQQTNLDKITCIVNVIIFSLILVSKLGCF